MTAAITPAELAMGIWQWTASWLLAEARWWAEGWRWEATEGPMPGRVSYGTPSFPWEQQTGAERYFADRMADPEYRAAYEAAGEQQAVRS